MASPSVTEVIKEMLDEVRADIRRVTEVQVDMVRVQERQAATLEEHIRRTEAAESAIETVRAELAPLKVHDAVWGAAAKVLAATGALVSIAVGIGKLLGWLG
jgi:hypothetical protein